MLLPAGPVTRGRAASRQALGHALVGPGEGRQGQPGSGSSKQFGVRSQGGRLHCRPGWSWRNGRARRIGQQTLPPTSGGQIAD